METLLEIVINMTDEDWQMLLDQRRFWRQVDRSGGEDSCWIWTGCNNGMGYGVGRYNKKTNHAHRIAYLLTAGRTLDRLTVVRHKCDNKLCCNPKHLEEGTHADNIRDWQERLIDQKGEHNFASKLTNSQVAEIKEMLSRGIQGKEIAPIFGVSIGTISMIKSQRTWKGIGDQNE